MTRFTYLGRPLVPRPQGDGAIIESYPDPDRPRFEVADAGGMIQLSIPQLLSETTSLPWPADGTGPVELAPVIVETVDRVDPQGSNGELHVLRSEAQRG
ncbi:hypothetical protein [Symbioplanes lichenis]|uniref:hypothetical protein n=1 Tax=Symbioplanes lichenis TaxID=1629072 RepID=UPI0027398817|nr:hypothetical protein [Actinoplanes lichenis]